MKKILAAMLLGSLLCACKKDKTSAPAKNPWVTNSPRIYFEGSLPGKLWTEIYSVNLDGSDQQRHTFFSPNNIGEVGITSLSFSPDGNTLAFVSSKDKKEGEIFLMNLNDPDNIKKIIPNNEKGSSMHSVFMYQNAQKIVYMHEVDSFMNRHGEIFTANIDGSNIKRLTIPIVDNAYSPSVSPDNSSILFSNLVNGHFQMNIMNIDGSNKREIVTTFPDSKRFPRFSPDGKKIAFTGSYYGKYAIEIYIMDADGSNVRQLTNFSSNYTKRTIVFAPVFSNDGKSIYFCGADSEWGVSQLYRINTDGTDLIMITSSNTLEKFFPAIK